MARRLTLLIAVALATTVAGFAAATKASPPSGVVATRCRPPYLPMQANCNALRSFSTTGRPAEIAHCRPPYLPMQANCNAIRSFPTTASTAADK
jgi:hypothetical protein